jgi:hypothetical protein
MKKGITGVMITLIILLVAFIVMYPAMTRLYAIITGSSEDEACKLSIEMHAAYKKATLNTVVPAITCPRKEIIFYQDHIDIRGKKAAVQEIQGQTKKVTTFRSITPYYVNQVLAKELKECWELGGEGKVNVFENDFLPSVSTKDYNVCLVCAQMKFQLEQDNSFSGLVAYMGSNAISTIDNKNPITYQMYFDQFKQPSVWAKSIPWTHYTTDTSPLRLSSKIMPGNEATLDSKNSYAIVFQGFKPDTLSQVTGAFDSAYYVILMQTEEVAQYCSYIVN